MRTTILFLALLPIIVGAAWVSRVALPPTPPPAPQPIMVHSQGPTIERLEQLSHVVTIRVYVADILTGEGNGCRGAWLIRGDALIAVDLTHATISEKDEENKSATIQLPKPQILQARVDHERTRTWEVKTTTWIPWASDQDNLRDAVMLQAQQLVAHAAGSTENIQQAKTATESAIRAFYSEVGWQVKVEWVSVPSEDQALVSLSQPAAYAVSWVSVSY